jgi:hypothetical protein
MKKNKKKLIATNFIADLLQTNPSLGLTVAYALESSSTFDQALACARFAKLAYRQDIELFVRDAVQSIGIGLDAEAAFKLTVKVATEVLNDYSIQLVTASSGLLNNTFNKRHEA